MKIKALPKKIHTLIHIRIYSYWDKTNGNNYCSARCLINNDYENELIYPIEYNSVDQMQRDIIKHISKLNKRLSELPNFMASDFTRKGFNLEVHVSYENQSSTKRFGTKKG